MIPLSTIIITWHLTLYGIQVQYPYRSPVSPRRYFEAEAYGRLARVFHSPRRSQLYFLIFSVSQTFRPKSFHLLAEHMVFFPIILRSRVLRWSTYLQLPPLFGLSVEKLFQTPYNTRLMRVLFKCYQRLLGSRVCIYKQVGLVFYITISARPECSGA